MHIFADLNLEDIKCDRYDDKNYWKLYKAYSNSKLANILHANLMNEKFPWLKAV